MNSLSRQNISLFFLALLIYSKYSSSSLPSCRKWEEDEEHFNFHPFVCTIIFPIARERGKKKDGHELWQASTRHNQLNNKRIPTRHTKHDEIRKIRVLVFPLFTIHYRVLLVWWSIFISSFCLTNLKTSILFNQQQLLTCFKIRLYNDETDVSHSQSCEKSLIFYFHFHFFFSFLLPMMFDDDETSENFHFMLNHGIMFFCIYLLSESKVWLLGMN